MFFFFRPEWIGSRRWVDGAQHRQKKSVRITGPRPAVTTRATLPIRRCTEYRTSCLLCFPYTTVLRVRTVLKSLTLVHVRCAKIVISVCGVGQSTLLDRAVNAPVETDTHAHRHSTQHTGCTRAIDRSIDLVLVVCTWNYSWTDRDRRRAGWPVAGHISQAAASLLVYCPPSTRECNYGIRAGQIYSSLTSSKVNIIYTYNFK
jgi:hypothetical protein